MADPAENLPAQDAADEWVSYQTEPSRYRHWRLKVEGNIATLIMDTAAAAASVTASRRSPRSRSAWAGGPPSACRSCRR